MGPDALDFWIGIWICVWEGGGGSNTIARELGGAVVVERFEAGEPEPFSGMSVSVHDARTNSWRQTWVDSNGSYWHFAGAHEGEDVIFATPGRVDADQTYKRMVFSGIGAEAFHWRWESSDDGRAWAERWAIDYRRAVPSRAS